MASYSVSGDVNVRTGDLVQYATYRMHEVNFGEIKLTPRWTPPGTGYATYMRFGLRKSNELGQIGKTSQRSLAQRGQQFKFHFVNPVGGQITYGFKAGRYAISARTHSKIGPIANDWMTWTGTFVL